MTVGELKKWINSIPQIIDDKNIDYLSVEFGREPQLSVGFDYKSDEV